MEDEFWHDRWRKGEIAFHEGTPNAQLRAYLPALGLKAGARIFLPLCGKTRDMSYLLEQGYEVVGAELSRLAIEQLFAERGETPQLSQEGPLERFTAGKLTVHVGNIFDLDPATLGPVNAIYDRAALVALPPEMRARYAEHLVALTRAAPQLLIAFDYDQAQMAGPPFAVPESEIRRHYARAYHVEGLGRHELKDGLRGIRPVFETAFSLARR